ncbi:DUF4232 domain-containing protein [Streptomyces tagetis]|uniref:DUF4232 domain-containing protein n=1 Tax=Streptomyces tagetis TaxID=2820809 RepID=A0A940XIT0_9ACTN|nr:DUF4232 domain-containing protein [Streptomyces sp. RG38]MBQ0827331.1 DUF4232 domain-containing protein [Streptomyces sp. RG38]
MRTTGRTRAATTAITLAATLLLTACGGGDADRADASAAGTDDRGGAACRTGDMDVSVEASPAPATGDTGTVTVNLANQGGTCTLDGFPPVTLATDDTSARLVPAEAAAPQRLTLSAEATASFTITYVRGEAGAASGFTAQTAEFALPGDKTTHRFPWTYGDVAPKADGGEGPDATVGAFQAAGD